MKRMIHTSTDLSDRSRAYMDTTSPEELSRLADSPDTDVREAVASNPNTPPNVLAKLASDESGYVRWSAAENPSTPVKVLRELVRNADPNKGEDLNVLQGVASNPSTPVKLLEKLINPNMDKYVRNEALRNPSIPAELLTKLAEEGDTDTREYVARHPNTPLDVVEKLFFDPGDEHGSLKHYVGENPNVSFDTYRKWYRKFRDNKN